MDSTSYEFTIFEPWPLLPEGFPFSWGGSLYFVPWIAWFATLLFLVALCDWMFHGLLRLAYLHGRGQLQRWFFARKKHPHIPSALFASDFGPDTPHPCLAWLAGALLCAQTVPFYIYTLPLALSLAYCSRCAACYLALHLARTQFQRQPFPEAEFWKNLHPTHRESLSQILGQVRLYQKRASTPESRP